MKHSTKELKDRAVKIIRVFKKLYPGADTTLEYKDPLQLLVSTILAAQSTDVKVNEITKGLYKKYRNAGDFANADLRELEKEIKPLGFFRNKSQNIKNACSMIIEEYKLKVPDNIDDMLRLPGVGRKTANLVLGDAYGIPGIVVDTHCKRLSNRIGFTQNKDPVKIENDLNKVIPKDEWNLFCHQMVYHGRAVCKARKPGCEECDILKHCDFGQKKLIDFK